MLPFRQWIPKCRVSVFVGFTVTSFFLHWTKQCESCIALDLWCSVDGLDYRCCSMDCQYLRCFSVDYLDFRCCVDCLDFRCCGMD